MKTYTVKNQNDVIIYRGKSAADAAQEKREYEHQTGNFCTVETEEVPVMLNYADYKNCFVHYPNKFYNNAAEADQNEALQFAAIPSVLDSFQVFSDVYDLMLTLVDADTTFGFVNSRGQFIDAANIQKDGDKSPREIIEGMTA